MSVHISISFEREEELITVLKAHIKTLGHKYIYDKLLFGMNRGDEQRLLAALKLTWSEFKALTSETAKVDLDNSDRFRSLRRNVDRDRPVTQFEQMVSYCLLDYADLQREDFESGSSDDEDDEEDGIRCVRVIKSGKRKGEVCGKLRCKTHKKREDVSIGDIYSRVKDRIVIEKGKREIEAGRVTEAAVNV